LNSSGSLSHSSAASPFSGEALIKVSMINSNKELLNVLIGLTKQALQTQENRLDVVRCSPLVLQDVQTDSPREVYIRVVDWGLEENRRSGVGVIGREGERQLESKTGVRSVIGSFYCRSPRKKTTIGIRESRDARSRRGHKLHQLGL
jgi:hypothetical protein